MRADLHVHSSASDGTDPPAEVMAGSVLAGSLTLLPGMELSCRLAGRSMHLLAYVFDAGQPDLAAELSRIRDDRVLRARAMVDRLADLGVDISWDQVAAIAGRALVGRYALDPVRAIGLVRAAGGVAALAHPRAGRDTLVSDEQIAGLAAAGLAGLEVFHPDQSGTERAGLLALVATAGSDDHGSLTGHRIGAETVGAEAYRALLARVPSAP